MRCKKIAARVTGFGPRLPVGLAEPASGVPSIPDDLLPGYPDRRDLSGAHRALLQALAASRPARTPKADDLDELMTRWLIQVSESGSVTVAQNTVPNWIWLPNVLVVAAADETVPVERFG